MLEDVGEFEEASIYIEPSPVAAITDEDSADEDEGGTYSNLRWNNNNIVNDASCEYRSPKRICFICQPSSRANSIW